MKKVNVILALMSVSALSFAQSYYRDYNNPDIVRTAEKRAPARNEIIIPAVNGFNVYKADLHTHTVYSDGDATPELRVKEAWFDGLDILAVTDHIEYRRQEGKMIAFLKGYVKNGAEAINTNLITEAADKKGIQSDLHLPVKLAQKQAERYGITIIPGAEITREPVSVGHFNALFTVDNNAIYDPDPVQAVRNAKAQGALVMHNHPGWKRKSLEQPETEKRIYEAGLVDGIETMNGSEFYPKAIERAHELKLFVSSNTDMHDSATETYRAQGHMRNMTLILAKDQSLESIREALESRRTLSYSYGTLAGDEQLLKDLFNACVSLSKISEDSKKIVYRMTNNSSLDFVLKDSGNPISLRPFTTITVNVSKKSGKTYTVLNMWCGDEIHPKVNLGM